jgi:carbon monoxide dehydrogenase subunit G
MRIEGSYTVAAPTGQVYDTLMTPRALGRTIPGCERLIQLGPPDAEGGSSFEARVRADTGMWTISLRAHGGRQHNRVEFAMRASGFVGSCTGRGSITLVRHAGQTLLSYSAAIEDAQAMLTEEALQHVALRCGEGLALALAEAADPGGGMRTSGDADHVLATSAEQMGIRRIGRRAAWMASGLLVGVAVVALVSSLARRLAARE